MTVSAEDSWTWPEGLEFFVLSVPVHTAAFHPAKFLGALEGRKGLTRHGDTALFFFRDSDGSGGSGRFGPDQDGDLTLEFSFRSDAYNGDALELEDVQRALHAALDQPALIGIVFATFQFPIALWRPKITFPVAAPGIAEQIGGVTPQLMGLEITYPTEGIPLRRIGISVFANAPEFSVQQLLHVSVLEDNLLAHIGELMMGYLHLIATRILEPSSVREVGAGD
jgi:hypothetical protein